MPVGLLLVRRTRSSTGSHYGPIYYRRLLRHRSGGTSRRRFSWSRYRDPQLATVRPGRHWAGFRLRGGIDLVCWGQGCHASLRPGDWEPDAAYSRDCWDSLYRVLRRSVFGVGVCCRGSLAAHRRWQEGAGFRAGGVRRYLDTVFPHWCRGSPSASGCSDTCRRFTRDLFLDSLWARSWSTRKEIWFAVGMSVRSTPA